MRRIGTKNGKRVHLECVNRPGEPICHLRGTYYARVDGTKWNRPKCEKCEQAKWIHLLLARERRQQTNIQTRVTTDKGAST